MDNVIMALLENAIERLEDRFGRAAAWILSIACIALTLSAMALVGVMLLSR